MKLRSKPPMRPADADSPRLIAVEGPLRVGKTSLADILARHLNAEPLRDVEENPFLEAFYQDKPGAAFEAQMYFLRHRYQQWRGLDFSSSAHRVVVSDYLFDKDKIFAYLNLAEAELKLYEQFYELFADQVPIPDLVVYLQAKPETLETRIARKRVRAESKISAAYLEEVVRAYEHFFLHYNSSNLLVVDTSEMDFVHRNADLKELLQRISQPVIGTQYFVPLGSASAD